MIGNGARCSVLLALLGLVYVAAIAAGFIAPADPATQNRDFPFAPPTRLHFVDTDGRFHLRPFVYRLTRGVGTFDDYTEDRSRSYDVRFLVRGAPYRLIGLLESDRHLFGTDSPSGLFLFGSDGFGRDQFSRFLHGAQLSLFAGLLGAALSLGIGALLGGLAGFYGGWMDQAVMRTAEVFLAVPWFYLLFAVRMALPLNLQPSQTFLMVLAVIGFVGWSRPAFVVRGVVLSAKQRDYVVAARGLGATDGYLLRRHVLPQVMGIALTQAALLAPQYTLAEVTLSFFGLGVSEPVPSWGNMLATLQRYDVLSSYWWMFVPGIALILVFLLYYSLADAFHQRAAAF